MPHPAPSEDAVAGRCRHPPRGLLDGHPQCARVVRCRVRARALPMGGPALSGSPLDPDQISPDCRRIKATR